ncbi:MAG: hypothetical protein PHW50_01610 [Patescibacteria group bacterium]|nr:hypothetical protein [Patescibacteria group bacterium]
MEKSIFSKFDIRGKYPEELNETVAYRLGLRLGEMVTSEQVVVGTDIRETSQKLVDPLAAGLEKSGKRVLFLEKVATEMVYYAVSVKKLNLGVQLTASHNPWDETGLKIVSTNALPFSCTDNLLKLEQLFQKSTEEYGGEKPQNLTKINLAEGYAQFTIKLLPDLSKLSGKLLVISFGEAGGELAERFFAKTKVQTKIVVFDKKKLGDLPPNPMLAENQELALKQVNKSFDLVAMLDGDSDRVLFINPVRKEVVLGDLTASLIAKYILENQKGPIVFDLRKKMVMEKVAQEFAVPFYQTYAGYPFVKKEMIKRKAVFGGELSGHLFYPKNNYCENSMLTIALLLSYFGSHHLSFDQALVGCKDIFSMPEENFDLSEIKDFDLNQLTKDLEENLPNAKISQSDGMVVEGSDFYANIRLSQNEPLLRLNLEAKNKETLDLVYQQIKDLLQ